MTGVIVGKYIPGRSVIHKMNPHLKLITNIIFIVLVFMTQNIFILGSLLIFAMNIFLLSRLRLVQLWRMLIPVLFIGFFLFIINMILISDGYDQNAQGFVDYDLSSTDGYFFNTTKTWIFTISDKVLFQTIFLMMRIYIMIIITTLLTATTKPIALTKAIEDVLFPLRLIFVPVHIIAMIISIALRFIPTLLEEAQRIMKAQSSRGVDFKNGGIKSKSKSLITLIIPLFVSAFAKAEDLSQAMETRGYDPYQKRTRYRVYVPKLRDYLGMIAIIGVITIVALYTNDVFPTAVWFI